MSRIDALRKAAREGRLVLAIRKDGQTLFDTTAADEAGQKGMDLALRNVAEWKQTARAWVKDLPYLSHFTADDLVQACGLPTDREGLPTNNSIGAFINALNREGLIMGHGYTRSSRVSNHGRVLKLWTRTAKE